MLFGIAFLFIIAIYDVHIGGQLSEVCSLLPLQGLGTEPRCQSCTPNAFIGRAISLSVFMEYFQCPLPGHLPMYSPSHQVLQGPQNGERSLLWLYGLQGCKIGIGLQNWELERSHFSVPQWKKMLTTAQGSVLFRLPGTWRQKHECCCAQVFQGLAGGLWNTGDHIAGDKSD